MNNKYSFINILMSLLCLNNILVSGHRLPRELTVGLKPQTDELDRSMIDQTGCKFVSLAKGESVLFTKTSPGLSHSTLAELFADRTLRDQHQTNLELHLAVRSDSELQVLLFTRRHYVNISTTEADYKIGFGAVHNPSKTYLQFESRSDIGFGMGDYRDKPTKENLSSDKYVKFFVKLDDNEMKIGKQCSTEPILSSDKLGYYAPEFVQFGFLSKSDNGARVLYDCPSNFAGCPCDWVVQ